MAAGLEVQAYVGFEERNPAVKSIESDTDSGQGSCEMVSSHRMEGLDDEDSDEEIVVSKKSKNKRVIVESDSEGEDVTATERHEEDNKENISGPNGKSVRIRSVLLDSEDSDREDKTESVKTSSEPPTSERDTSALKQKKSRKMKKEDTSKLKSKRRTEKTEKRMASLGKLKKEKKEKLELPSEKESPLLNDSGCLLADRDLFENEVGDESDTAEEESLDAIRATVTDKLKGHSKQPADYEGSDCEQDFEDGPNHGDKRKERKAARMSKEAMKQLHSETQRLMRESTMSLPYHLPEPKTIHDFFKRRPRQSFQGNAMQLIKSSKYQSSVVERTNTHVNKGTEFEKCDSAPAQEPTVDAKCLFQGANDVNLVDQEANKFSAEEECEPITFTDNPGSSSKMSGSGEEKDSIHGTVEHAENIVHTVPQEITNSQSRNKDGEMDPRNGSSSLTTDPVRNLPKLSKLEKLRALGVDLSLKPRLCADDGFFVNLDDPEPNKELEALKQRFLKHSLQKAKPVAERKININVVHKETTAEGKEELKADVVPVTMAAENPEENIHTKPGEKLLVLKAKLQEAMKVRRNEERQKRQALIDLDNEDGFDDEEEAEMTEESEEEEGNAETAEYLLGEADEEHDELDKDLPEALLPERRSINTESTLMLFKDQSSKLGDSLPDKIDNGNSKGNGKLEEDDSILTKENSHNSSFELIGSMIPSYQPFNKNMRGSLHSAGCGFRSPSPMHFKTSFLSSASKSSGKMSEEPSLPVEDSQDLYNASPEPKASYLCPGGGSQFQFSLEDDTQSQLLDADGFLNVGHHRNKYSSAKHRLVLDTMDENAMDANMGELLDLCSGQFNESSQAVRESKENAIEELLGLCSGKFVSQTDTSTQNCSPSKSLKESQNNNTTTGAAPLCSGSFTVESENKEEEEEEEEFGEFQLLPCDESDEQEEESGDEENEGSDDEKGASDEEDEEEVLRRQQNKKKLRLKDFMENEAELSGSDIDSGDEEEGEDDEYEEEAIDEELPSDEELQDQVNKIHMKVTMDEDKRRLRLYQERYLADGDLHSDGPGRIRKYKWKMFDDASQMDLFRRDSELEDQEVDEELDEAEIKRRKERFEREQWLREQSETGKNLQEEEDIGEDSQFMKLAKKVTAKVLQRRATTESKDLKRPFCRNPFEMMRPFSQAKMQTGSLLNKPKDVLQKLAAMSDLNPNAPRNSRNFVFHTISPAKKEAEDRPKPKVRKNISLVTPSPKRLKLDDSSKGSSRSIFPFLEN